MEPTTSLPANRRSGFTLIELSVVLVIIAVLTGLSATMGVHMVESAREAQTRQKLDGIEQALLNYRILNNRLPCPADPKLLTSDSNYGAENGTAGDCSGGTGVRIDSTNNVAEGALPFKQLNIPASFMYDGWGHKFAYAVNYNVTALDAMAGQILSDQCKITVKDADTANSNRSTGAIYALVSFGSDGHGAYLRNGTRLNAGSINTSEQTNCHCDNSAVETT